MSDEPSQVLIDQVKAALERGLYEETGERLEHAGDGDWTARVIAKEIIKAKPEQVRRAIDAVKEVLELRVDSEDANLGELAGLIAYQAWRAFFPPHESEKTTEREACHATGSTCGCGEASVEDGGPHGDDPQPTG